MEDLRKQLQSSLNGLKILIKRKLRLKSTLMKDWKQYSQRKELLHLIIIISSMMIMMLLWSRMELKEIPCLWNLGTLTTVPPVIIEWTKRKFGTSLLDPWELSILTMNGLPTLNERWKDPTSHGGALNWKPPTTWQKKNSKTWCSNGNSSLTLRKSSRNKLT